MKSSKIKVGMTLAAAVVVTLLTACWFIPWPDTTVVHGQMEVTGLATTWHFRKHVEAEDLRLLQAGMEAHITLDVKDDSWGYYTGTLEPLPLRPDSTGLYLIEIAVDDLDTNKKMHEYELWTIQRREDPWLMDATATIIIRPRRLLPRLLGID